MGLDKPDEMLEALMRGYQVTPADLDAFLAANDGEGQLYDYKSGALTANREKLRTVIREWITGFANSDGGMLIIGPADKAPHVITACQKMGNEEIADWAQKTLEDMAPMFSPMPRFWTVKHPAGDVLFIGTERAPQLIHVREGRKWTYYLRMGTSTLEAPEYLISDLLLGRRKHPVLDLKLTKIQWDLSSDNHPGNPQTLLSIEASFALENRSLVRARHVEVGIVGWTASQTEVPVNDHILTYVDAVRPTWCANRHSWYPTVIACRHHPHPLEVVAPFERREMKDVRGLVLPGDGNGFYRCGVYVMPEGGPPKWYQLEVKTDGAWLISGVTIKPSYSKMTAVPYGGRPEISYLEGTEALAAIPK